MSFPVIDNVSFGSPADNQTSYALPVTVSPALANSILVVLVAQASFQRPASVDYGGSPMTAIRNDGGNFFSSIWWMKSPPSGTASVNVNWSVIERGTGVIAFGVSGADQSKPLISSVNGATSGTASDSVTTLVNDCMVANLVMSFATSHTEGLGQVPLANFLVTSGSYRMSGSYDTYPAPTPVTMTTALGISTTWQSASVAILPPQPVLFVPSMTII